MFYGHFQESIKGPDDPVLLENVNPEAFDAAMRYSYFFLTKSLCKQNHKAKTRQQPFLLFRFIYGSDKDFKDALVAVDVYKFAHEMQLDNLVASAGKYLHDVSPDNLIPVYNLFTLTSNEEGLKNCREVGYVLIYFVNLLLVDKKVKAPHLFPENMPTCNCSSEFKVLVLNYKRDHSRCARA
jgi:hypothetical protein